MALEERQDIMRRIEEQRKGRVLICFLNFDRPSNPDISGLSTQFSSDTKEALLRVLKETVTPDTNIDLFLYTRGGDTNAVWPITSLLREFDPDFEVLVSFRCHSGGTLLSLGAMRIVMTPLSELSPIDPTTGNQFNPSDPSEPHNRLGISVEDVQQYRSFILDQFGIRSGHGSGDSAHEQDILRPFLDRLAQEVHPLALGNVHRVHLQIKQLAQNLLDLHPSSERNMDMVVSAFTTQFYSHLHMINRYEARKILGEDHVEFASEELSQLMDELLREYEQTFSLRRPFFLNAHLGKELEKEARFIGGAIESKTWSYLFETEAKLRQHSAVPPQMQVQLSGDQGIPLIPGLPRQYDVEIMSQSWERNAKPRGVTV